MPIAVDSPWYKASVDIISFEPEELFGTKLRAFLQRRKGRDLFDLNEGLSRLELSHEKLVASFEHYMKFNKQFINRAIAEERMLMKLERSLVEDILPMLPVGVLYTEADAIEAFGKIWTSLISKLKGKPWKLSSRIIQELRESRMPQLLA